jgi:molecular chaperone Hsp33
MLGKMSLLEAVGKGVLQVVKNHPDWPRPYNGITEIRHGDIDRDVGIYLAESEQRSCALAAATAVKGILCVAAGGYLIEQLPGCTKEEIAHVERNLGKLVEMDGGDQLPTNLLLSGTTPLEIVEIILEGLDRQPLQHITPELLCDCTEDRLLRALRLLPQAEVEDLLKKQEQLEARCQFCGKVYRMEAWQAKEKLETATGDPSLDADFEDKSK